MKILFCPKFFTLSGPSANKKDTAVSIRRNNGICVLSSLVFAFITMKLFPINDDGHWLHLLFLLDSLGNTKNVFFVQMVKKSVYFFICVAPFNIVLKAYFVGSLSILGEIHHHATPSSFFRAFSSASSFACWKKGVVSITLTSL